MLSPRNPAICAPLNRTSSAQDGTLVNRKSNSQFARASDDWRWWNKGVPDKLAELVGDGFKVVIFRCMRVRVCCVCAVPVRLACLCL
jgi:hypothetical protein